MGNSRCRPLIGSADRVRRRVAYRLIAQSYRREPEMYSTYAPSGVLELAERFRKIYPFIYPELAWYARNLAAGFTLKELRDSGWEYSNRALTKRRVAPPKRYD